MPRIQRGHPAEEVLYEMGAIQRRSLHQQAVIGCIGCRWLEAEEAGEEPRVYGYQIMRCSQIKSGVIYPILRRLEESGALVRSEEDTNTALPGRPPKVNYIPSETEVGLAFRERLEKPQVCSLDLD
jgi:hypothetical protein